MKQASINAKGPKRDLENEPFTEIYSKFRGKIYSVSTTWHRQSRVFSVGKGTYRPRIDLRQFSFFFAPRQGSCYILESKCNVFEVKNL